MAAAAKEIFIVSGKRLPFGKYGGKLASVSATRMATEAARAALTAGKVAPEIVDSVYFGNVTHSSGGESIYVARHAALAVGIPATVPAVLVNRMCGSGFESIVQAYREIALGDAQVALAGGVDSMTQAPFVLRNIRFGTTLGATPKLEDTLWDGLTDTWCKLPMALTAENLAVKYGISRQECDEFSYNSHQKWHKAHKAGYFKAELAPITVKGKKKEEVFDMDEHPRPDTTMEMMAKLPSIFKKDGTVTAATASGINDGAGAVILASAQAVKDHGLTPLARIVSFHTTGVSPDIMGIGPVTAIQGALKKAGLQTSDMGLVEINEAFASQLLACNRELKFDPAKLNVCGGAIAIGHPLAGSGSRIMSHLAHTVQRTKDKYAVGSACIGGGMGIAIVIERC